MKISILHPSRSRPDQALNACHEWISSMSQKNQWEYILSLDTSDPALPDYEKFKGGQNMRSIINDNKNLVEAANQAARLASGDIIILISDDFKCSLWWDVSIIIAFTGRSGVLKTYDGVQSWIVTLPIMTRDYYQEQGYLYYPGMAHMFCDTYMTHKADLQKKLIIRNDIVFPHNHYSVKGGQPKDAVNLKADGTWAQGEKVYLEGCRNKFGLNGVDIYDLSPEATKAGHIAWLKKKGIK